MDFPEDALPAPTTQELPIPDYKHLPRLDVEPRVGDLGKEEVETVLRYEREHRGRTPVIRLLTARLHRLRESRPVPSRGHGYGPAPR
jgi:hypothetical protein